MSRRLDEAPKFVSNPNNLRRVPVIELSMDDEGSAIDRFTVKTVDNRGCLQGASYDASRHSLIARLNVGIPLEKVSIGCTENDPNVLVRSCNRIIDQINSNIEARANAAAFAHLDSTSEPNSEPISEPKSE